VESRGSTLGGTPELALAGRPHYVGARISRLEDDRPVTGRASYVADIALAGAAEMAVVRSISAHAEIERVDVEAARSAPGVVAVITAADLADVRPFPDFFPYAKPVRHFPLARDKVRYVGAPIAAVVAENRYLAEDAAELVQVEYGELPAVGSIRAALAEGAPRLFDDWPDNKMVDLPEGPMASEVDAIMSGFQVVRGEYTIHRHTGVPMETRGSLARFEDGRLTLWSTAQLPHVTRTSLSYVLPLVERDIRVIAPDVGGGFGVKQHCYPEEVLVSWLAMRLGRPVRWIEDRAEHLVATVHARDEIIEIEGAVRDDGTIAALRCRVYHDVGTGEVFYGGFAPGLTTTGHMSGPYRIDKLAVSFAAVATNKTPAGSFRGYGVPEAVFALERFIDRAAREVGADPLEARRRMLLSDDDLPWKTPEGALLDSGSFREAYDRAIELGREAAAKARDRFAPDPDARVGLGIATYREGTVPTHFGASGNWTAQESAYVRVDPDGSVTVSSGGTSQGQGTVSLLATVVADTLGVPIETIGVVLGDTDRCPYGLGAWGSRLAVCGGGAALKAATRVRQKAMRIAAHLLEASSDDLEALDGQIRVRGTDRAVTLAEVSTVANIRTFQLPSDEEPGLESTAFYEPPRLQHVPDAAGKINACAAWANATHAAVVKVDVETGRVDILDYVVAHDCGPMINPVIVDGQIVGGVIHGIGGAMYEDLPYSKEGQPLAVSFMDYLLPTAAESPAIALEHFESPSPALPLGAKGVGEGGTCGPLGAIGNAIADALDELGVDVVSSPFSPAAIRALVRSAGSPGL
jgi:carbon-monoxide dehydrogenase large subunit